MLLCYSCEAVTILCGLYRNWISSNQKLHQHSTTLPFWKLSFRLRSLQGTYISPLTCPRSKNCNKIFKTTFFGEILNSHWYVTHILTTILNTSPILRELKLLSARECNRPQQKQFYVFPSISILYHMQYFYLIKNHTITAQHVI
jgi:hypothetical protein